MPDPWTAAWEEAEATAPPGVLMYATLELQHPAFVDNGNPFAIRAVAGTATDQIFTIEGGAVLNPGAPVTFKAIPFFAERPTFEQGKTPECVVTVDNVAREIVPYLENAVSLRADMLMIFREYRSDDTSAPCFGPVEFTVKQVKVTGTKVSGTARIDDLNNRRFPNKVYTLTDFPSLQPG